MDAKILKDCLQVVRSELMIIRGTTNIAQQQLAAMRAHALVVGVLATLDVELQEQTQERKVEGNE